MGIKFLKLNRNWNAEPNAPEETVTLEGLNLILEFTVNSWAYEGFEEEERAKLIFKNCYKFRVGPTNDEGWYLGQCRFGRLAPQWGEFYQIIGSSPTVVDAKDWKIVGTNKTGNHYLFYLRDSTFECVADSFIFQRSGS